MQKVRQGDKIGHAVAELAYVRCGGALRGEADVDGELAEWDEHLWFPVGESTQARWTTGPADNRADPQECYMHWAVKAGEKGIYFAVRGIGRLQKDRFTIFFDTRAPALLGTAGPYYWCGGTLSTEGRVRLSRGETSRKAAGLKGAWKETAQGTVKGAN